MEAETMKISELIKHLELIKTEHGDLPVKWESISHKFDIELSVLGEGDSSYLQVN